MTEIIRTIAFLIALTTAPGVIADLAVRLIQALRFNMFPLISPDRVPHEMAIYVTQWWLTFIGLALLAAATHSWIHERNNQSSSS